MVNYMLAKLKSQLAHAVSIQQGGDFSSALEHFELVLEALHYYDGLGYTRETDEIRNICIEAQSTPVQALYCQSLVLFYRQ